MTPDNNAPDYLRGYLRIPHPVWAEVFCRAPLTRRQLQLVACVIRESWGWQAPGGGVYLWTRPFAPGQFARATGLSTDHLTGDLRALTERGVLLEKGRRYQFVPHPELWKTPASSPQKRRSAPPEPPDPTAKSAPGPPTSKKRKQSKRNVPPASRNELSPPVDKPRAVRTADPTSSESEPEFRVPSGES